MLAIGLIKSLLDKFRWPQINHVSLICKLYHVRRNTINPARPSPRRRVSRCVSFSLG